jgi:hypothetical protein
MKSIDFLPQKYKETDARRRAGLWRLGLVMLLGGTVAAASIGQFAYRAKVQKQISDVQPLLAQSKATEAHLTQLRNDLTKVSLTANLYAVVQTPWPQTQVIASIVEPLDETITIEEIHITHQQSEQASSNKSAVEFQLGTKKSNAPKLSPAQSDLQTIRRHLYERRHVVRLAGATNNQARMHMYLESLESSPMFERVELLDVDGAGSRPEPTNLRFKALLLVCPPLGQSNPHAAKDARGEDAIGRLAG